MKGVRKVLAIVLSVIMVLGVIQVPYQASEVNAEGGKYTITFTSSYNNLNDGNGNYTASTRSYSINAGDSLSNYVPGYSNDINNTHLILKGWKTKDTGTFIDNYQIYSYIPERDTEFEAISVEAWEITFVSDGSVMGSQYLEKGKNLSQYTSCYKDGYDLTGYKIEGTDEFISFSDIYSYPFDSDTTLVAQYTKSDTVNVTFVSECGYLSGNKDETTSTTKINRNSQLGYVTSPYGRDGYRFTGWLINGVGDLISSEDLIYYKPTTDVTIVAQWEAATSFTITLKANGGSFDYSENVPTKTFKISEGDRIGNYNNIYAYRENYTFIGWKNDATNEICQYISDIYPTGNMSFTAQWATTYQITFESSEGYISGEEYNTKYVTSVAAGNKVSGDPSVYGRNGYTFKGWSLKGSSTIIDIYNYTPSGDTTFVANWTSACNVTFYSAEGYFSGSRYNKTDEKQVEKGNEISYFSEPYSRPGYVVSGWMIDSNGDNVGDGELLSYEDVCDYTINSDTTFVAQWSASYKLTFKSSEGYINGNRFSTESTYNVKQGDTVGYDYPSCYNRTGYVMTGWRVGDTDTVISKGDIYKYKPSSDTVFNAEWSAGYVITFKSESGYINGNAYQKEYSYSIGIGDSINDAPYCGNRKGYELKGWKKEGTDTVITNLSTYVPEGNETLIAVWGEAVTLTFKANGGSFWDSSTSTTMQVLKNTPITDKYTDLPTKNGYIFDGWKNDSTGVISKGYYISGTFSSNTSFTAQWAQAYTITFRSDEGYIYGNKNTKETQIVVKKGESLNDSPYVHGRPGYVFAYWSYNGQKIDSVYSFVPSGNITLKANWTKAINVTFDYNGGYSEYSNSGVLLEDYVQEVAQNTKINYWPSTPKKESQVFEGWKLQGDTSNKLYSNSEISNYTVGTSDIKFVASYKVAKNVTYDSNGGYWHSDPGNKYSGLRVIQVASGPVIMREVDTPYIDDGRLFIGWKQSGDTSGKIYSSNELYDYNIGDTDLTFVAQWGDPIEVTYDLNGGYYMDNNDHECTSYKEKIGKGGKLNGFWYTPLTKVSRNYLVGWQINGTGTVYSLTDLRTLTFNETTTIKAVWKSDGYIIRFESSAGYLKAKDANAKVYEYYVEPGTKMGYPAIAYTGDSFYRTGYELNYFTKKGDSKHYTSDDISNLVANSDMTFTANWSKLAKITFNANGGVVFNGPGGGSTTYTTYYRNGTMPYLYQPTYAGYTFQGWSERKANGTVGKTYIKNYSYTVNGDATLTAIWKNNTTGAIVQPSYLNPTKTVTPSAKTALPSTKTTTPKKTTPKYSEEWVNGKWYNKDGSQTYKGTMSWKSNSKGWWIEDSAGWYPTSAWQKIDGVWYYFKADGYMASNEYYNGYWFNRDGSWDSQYYLTWKSNSTGWWVEDKSGWWPANSWLKIDGSWYYFNGSGYMATSTYVDGYWIGANGVCQ